MLHKFRLLFLLTASLFLAACESETNEQAAITDSGVQEVTPASDEKNAEATVQKETIETTETELAEATVEEKAVTQETVETEEINSSEETVAVNAAAITEKTEQLNAEAQEAVHQLIEATDIDLENYVFFFTETADYIEIEVRENIDAEATPLVGIYRYIYETDELLANDYLTGEFIPFENVQ